MKRGSISKRLGVFTTGKLTKKMCLDKVRTLTEGLEKNKFKGSLRGYAVYYKNWYAWRARNMKRGSTSRPSTSRKAA